MKTKQEVLDALAAASVMKGISLEQLARRSPEGARATMLAALAAARGSQTAHAEAVACVLRPDGPLDWLEETPDSLVCRLEEEGLLSEYSAAWPRDAEMFSADEAASAVAQARRARQKASEERIAWIIRQNRHETEPLEGPARAGDEQFMQAALAKARESAAAGEVPVGAAVVVDGKVVAACGNAPVATHDPSGHAEIRALREAAAILGNYRMPQAELFVTLEPCTMCAGAILHARIHRVVWGADDPKAGAGGSVLDVFGCKAVNHSTHVTRGVLAGDCAQVLKDFFEARRQE